MQIKIHNIETNEIIERDMNEEELLQIEADSAKAAQIIRENESANVRKIALLEKLGITEDEAKLLLS